MAKKDFSTVNTEPVYSTIAQATAETPETQEPQEKPKRGRPRKTYEEYEAAEYIAAGKTSGRKGLKLPRINMAFSQTNYEYIQTMARVSGMTLTDFVNNIIYSHLQEHEDVYKKAIEFKNSI